MMDYRRLKLVLIGKNGLLGRDCRLVFQEAFDLVALGSKEVDITDPVQVEEMVRGLRPEVVVNCAGYTKVDAAERERALAHRLNVLGPRHLAVSLARHGGVLLQISTDYVFDGRKPVPESYREDEAVAPLSYYGQTKAAAEQVISQEMERYTIVRTSWLYGRWGHNFLRTILRLAMKPATSDLKVVNDQFGSPTWTRRLAQQLAALIAADGRGLYHATAEGWTTWFGLARHFLSKMGINATIKPCTSAQYATAVIRPSNAILENHRLKVEGIHLMRPWQADLDEFIDTFGAELLREAAAETGLRPA